jgi:hypothetical protein
MELAAGELDCDEDGDSNWTLLRSAEEDTPAVYAFEICVDEELSVRALVCGSDRVPGVLLLGSEEVVALVAYALVVGVGSKLSFVVIDCEEKTYSGTLLLNPEDTVVVYKLDDIESVLLEADVWEPEELAVLVMISDEEPWRTIFGVANVEVDASGEE